MESSEFVIGGVSGQGMQFCSRKNLSRILPELQRRKMSLFEARVTDNLLGFSFGMVSTIFYRSGNEFGLRA